MTETKKKRITSDDLAVSVANGFDEVHGTLGHILRTMATKDELNAMEIRTGHRLVKIENRLENIENQMFPRRPWEK